MVVAAMGGGVEVVTVVSFLFIPATIDMRNHLEDDNLECVVTNLEILIYEFLFKKILKN